MKNPHFRSSVSTKFDECCRLFCFLNFNLVDLIFQLFSSSNSFRHRRITALFTNMWIVKLKSQLTIACVAWRFCWAGRRSGVAALARLYYLARPTKTAMPRRLTDDWRLTTTFFAAVNHLNGPLRKQDFTLTDSKGHGLWFVIGGFRSVLCVSVFQGSLLVIVIMIDGSQKRNCEGGFWTWEFACLRKAQ